jgi:nuclear receptor interaction protein
LLHSARESPIPDVDASRFEVDNRRKAFRSESAAVIAFSSAIRMPLEDLSRAIMPTTSANGGSPANGDATPIPVAQDRMTALKFWAFKVGRGVLLNAGEGVTYQFVDTAFGGLGIPQPEEGRVQEDIDPDEIDDVVDGVSVVRRPLPERRDVQSASQNCEVTPEPRQHEPVDQDHPEDQTSQATWDFEMGGVPSRPRSIREPTVELDEAGSETEMVLVEDLHQEIVDQLAEDDEDGDEDAAEEDADEDSEDDEDDDITAEERQFMFQSAADRGNMRESVEAGVPCYMHSREYRGHCNVRTVKDCNFFGLQDEYVVSGSDSGHLFIWVECFTFQHHRPYSNLQQDKKTSQLVNILEGDGEVVNVVQGPSSILSHNPSPPSPTRTQQR